MGLLLKACRSFMNVTILVALMTLISFLELTQTTARIAWQKVARLRARKAVDTQSQNARLAANVMAPKHTLSASPVARAMRVTASLPLPQEATTVDSLGLFTEFSILNSAVPPTAGVLLCGIRRVVREAVD